MATISMSLKIDSSLKEKAQKVAKDLGFPLSTILNAYMRQLVKNKAIFFSTAPFYKMSRSLEQELSEVERDVKQNKNISPEFDSAKKAIDDLKQK